MSATPLSKLLLGACFLFGLSFPPKQETAQPEQVQIKPGMTGTEVRNRLQAPKRVARQILYRRYLEQWTYERPSRLVVLQGSKGQELHVLTVHEPAPGQP